MYVSKDRLRALTDEGSIDTKLKNRKQIILAKTNEEYLVPMQIATIQNDDK